MVVGILMGELVVTVDGKGRVLIPRELRERLGLRRGSRLRVRAEKARIVLEPLLPEPYRVRACREWGEEAFLDAGEATFGEG